MDEKIAKRWIEALRSGKFKQGKGDLRRGDQYCCLGVLCQLAVRSRVLSVAKRDFNNDYLYGKDKMSSSLPKEVMKWAGIDEVTTSPYLKIPESNATLTFLNDAEGLNFEEIADIIEKNYKKF